MAFQSPELDDIAGRLMEMVTGQLNTAVRCLMEHDLDAADSICRSNHLHANLTREQERTQLAEWFQYNIREVPRAWGLFRRAPKTVEREYAEDVLRGAIMLVGCALAHRLGARPNPQVTLAAMRGRSPGALHTAIHGLLDGATGLAGAVCGSEVRADAPLRSDAALLERLFGFSVSRSPEEFLAGARILLGWRLWDWSRQARSAPAAVVVEQPTTRTMPAVLQLLVRASKMERLNPGAISATVAQNMLQQATYFRCSRTEQADKAEGQLDLADGVPESDSEEDVYVRLSVPDGRGLVGETSKFGLRTALAGQHEISLEMARRVVRCPLEVLDWFQMS